MPGSSPRGLVQVLSMVLLSALSSEHFLTWLLNLLWAGTWHGAVSAPKVLAFLRTKCHRAWPRSAAGEGEAKRSLVAPCTPGVTLLCGLRARPRAARGGPGGQSSTRIKLEAAGSRGTRAGLAGASCSALYKPGSCCSWRNLHSPCSWSGCQQGPVWGPGGRESQPGFHSLSSSPAQLPMSAFMSLCQHAQVLTACRGCRGSADLASVPSGGLCTKLLKSTELVQGSRAAQAPGPSNPLPHSRRFPQVAFCRQRGDFSLILGSCSAL